METFEPQAVLYRQDDAADRLFIIHSGAVRITRRVFREEFTVETIGPGHVCGEVCVIGATTYPETAVAMDTVEALVVAADEVEDLLRQNGDVAVNVARRLAARLSWAHFRLANFALRSSLARVMFQLRAEALRRGAVKRRAWAPIPWDLPDVLGTERGTVRSCVRRLADDGLIAIDPNGQFSIVDLSGYDRLLSYLELQDRFDDSNITR